MFRRILLWFASMLVISFVGFVVTSYWTAPRFPGREPMFRRLSTFQLDEAVNAWERGGKTELAAFLKKLDSYFPATHELVDNTGHNLVTGEDRKEALARAEANIPRGRNSGDWMGLRWRFQRFAPIRRVSADGRFTLLIESEAQPPDPWQNIAVYGWIVAIIVLLSYALAWTLARPIRALRETVVQFGTGNLETRIHSRRGDEVGDLERAFDQMADRIQTLLAAERRLLQDISHELRSPLARLKFALELARSSSDPKNALPRVHKEVERLTVLVNELLQVTRAEGDPDSRNLAHIDLREFLTALVEDCRIEAEARGCTINLAIRDGVSFQGDPELLHRAVENVLRNAIHHAPAGTQIEVDLMATAEAVQIRIRDHGPGVPEEQLTEIFRPFYRVEEDRGRGNGGGVGLGLSIAERAIRAHKGEIRAQNADPGLVVELRLPR
ncbi:MAG: ATP-binding protein [Bryobacteraceae bacterium]|nr:ATP-binding protein [Bryobacteraceae bacterium]